MSLFDANSIFQGWIGETYFWRMFRRYCHSSRSFENADCLSQAAGELGPLGVVFSQEVQ